MSITSHSPNFFPLLEDRQHAVKLVRKGDCGLRETKQGMEVGGGLVATFHSRNLV